MSFRPTRSANDFFRPSFTNTDVRSSQLTSNSFHHFSRNEPQFRFQSNFTNTTPVSNFSTSAIRAGVLSNVAPEPPPNIYNIRMSNSEFNPPNQIHHNQFIPRQSSVNSLPYSSMNNNIHTLHNFPLSTSPVRFLSPERFANPNLSHQSPPSFRRDGPLLQNSAHQMLVRGQQQNISYHSENASLQSSLPVTSSYESKASNMCYSQANSFGKMTNFFDSSSNVPKNIDNLNVVSTCVNISCSVPTFTNSVAMSGSNNLILRPALPVSLQMPPPVMPSIIPVHMPPPPIPKFKNPASASYFNPLLSGGCEKESNLTIFLAKFSVMRKEKLCIKAAIPEFRSTLAAAFSISKELDKRKQKLQSLLKSDEKLWNSEMVQISNLKHKLSEICLFLSDPVHLNCIMKKLNSIKKKRKQKRKTKLNRKSAKLKAEQHRKELNQEIDKWLDDIKAKNLKLKREVEMKKEADIILLEVRKKIHEAKRTIEKIKVFEKLRNARKDNAVKKGLRITSEHDENFETKVSILKEMMSRQLTDYEAEERALKVMLETEQEGQLEEEVQWKLKKVKALQQKKQKQITECLFGNSGDPMPTDPLYLFHKYHTSAYSSVDNLIQIRHQWDANLAENGEAVPQQWVVPAAASDVFWEQCLITASGGSKN